MATVAITITAETTSLSIDGPESLAHLGVVLLVIFMMVTFLFGMGKDEL